MLAVVKNKLRKKILLKNEMQVFCIHIFTPFLTHNLCTADLPAVAVVKSQRRKENGCGLGPPDFHFIFESQLMQQTSMVQKSMRKKKCK